MTSQPASTSEGNALDRLLARRIEVNWELVAYTAIFAAAFALRFWDLGARALHHDESIHALWSWRLAQGSYAHNPVFHGPLLYFVQGFTFLVFTATDYTSRISPALFGMAVLAIPLALRRWLGPVGTLAVVAFLAFSPTVVYFSRFLRMDIYLAFFILLMVVAMWSYLHNGRTRWLFVFVVALALAFSTKEAAFLFVAFLLLYLNGHLALELAAANLQARKADTLSKRLLLAAALYPLAWVLAGLWRYLKQLRRRAAWGDLPRTGDLLVLTGSLTLPLLTAFAKAPLEVIFAAGPLDYPEVCANPSTRATAVLVTAFVGVCGVAAFAGLSWRPRTWLTAAAIGAIIYITLMTSLWTNAEGFCSGAWGSIDHWQAQHDYRRGQQPWFYYLMLMPAYEFLPLLIALAGGAWAMVRGSAFSRFLVLWFVFLFAALSFAGEKMPWLNTHLTIPAALLAAWTIQRAWTHWNPSRLDSRALLSIAFVMATAAFAASVLDLDWGPTLGVRLTWGLLPLLLTVGAALFVASRLGWRTLPALAALVLIVGLAFFSVRTMISVTFQRGDVPDDMLIYTQSSPDLTRMADEIDALALATGRGFDLRIAVDTPQSFAWPWRWYLRDYRRVSFGNMESGLPPGEFDVVLVHSSNADIVAGDLAARGATAFAPPTRYHHRWNYPETYKAALTAGPREPRPGGRSAAGSSVEAGSVTPSPTGGITRLPGHSAPSMGSRTSRPRSIVRRSASPSGPSSPSPPTSTVPAASPSVVLAAAPASSYPPSTSRPAPTVASTSSIARAEASSALTRRGTSWPPSISAPGSSRGPAPGASPWPKTGPSSWPTPLAGASLPSMPAFASSSSPSGSPEAVRGRLAPTSFSAPATSPSTPPETSG